MTPRWQLVGLVFALAIGALACSEKSGSDKFVGSWIYAGAIDPNCMNIAPIDLTGDAVTITATDPSHIRVDLAGYCNIACDVDGFTRPRPAVHRHHELDADEDGRRRAHVRLQGLDPDLLPDRHRHADPPGRRGQLRSLLFVRAQASRRPPRRSARRSS
jgi:hypothetical protein